MLVIVGGRLLIGCVVIELICLIIALVSKNRSTIINCSKVFLLCIPAGVLLTLYYLYNAVIELVSKLDTWSSFLKLGGASLLNVILTVIIFLRVMYHAADRPGLHNSPKRSGERDLRSAMNLNPMLKAAIRLLAAACLIKLGGVTLSFLFSVTFIDNLIHLPMDFIYFVSSLCMIAFLFLCAFLLNIRGMVVFSVIAALSSLLVYFAIFALELTFFAIILSVALCALLSYTVVLGTSYGSIFFVEGIATFTFVPVITPTIGAVPLAASVAAGKGITSAAGSSKVTSSGKAKNHLLTILINLIIIFVFSIPLLSATSALSGGLRNKPAYILGRQLFNRYNFILPDSSLDDFGTSALAAPLDIMKDSNGNFAQTNDEFNMDCDALYVSTLYGGCLSIRKYNSSESSSVAEACEACPIKNDENTVVIQLDERTAVLGNEEMFVLSRKNKHYMYRRYPWRAKFLAMSNEEQMDYIYHLLFEEYAGKEKAPIQDVALLRLSAQKGQLIHYDLDEKVIYFGSPNDDGTVTFLRQTAPGERSELATVTVSNSSGRVPYVWCEAGDAILCADGQEFFIVFWDGELSERYVTDWGEIFSINAYGEEDTNAGYEFVTPKAIAYKPFGREWGGKGLPSGIYEHCSGILHFGDSHIFSWYFDDFVHKFTFMDDRYTDENLIDRVLRNGFYYPRFEAFTD